MTGLAETPHELASRQIAEAQQRRTAQIELMAGLEGDEEGLAPAGQVLAEITRTLAIARMYRLLLVSLGEAE